MPPDLTDLQIFLVDDDQLMRRLVKRLLHELNCGTVREADNGEDAIPILSGQKFDVLIFDWQMDPINGLQLTRLVRRTAGNPNLHSPIIVLTAHTEVEKILAVKEAGATAVVAKPISFKSLAENISFVLRLPAVPPESESAAPDSGAST